MLQEINLKIERQLFAPIATVWTCLTDPALIAQWFMAIDFRPVCGHRFRIAGPAVPGWRGWTDVEVIEIKAPRKMVWLFDCTEEAPPSHVVFTLEDEGSFVRLTLTHDGRVPALTRELIEGGWTLYLAQLKELAEETAELSR